MTDIPECLELIEHKRLSVILIYSLKHLSELFIRHWVDFSLFWLIIENGTAHLEEVLDNVFGHSIKISLISVNVKPLLLLIEHSSNLQGLQPDVFLIYKEQVTQNIYKVDLI